MRNVFNFEKRKRQLIEGKKKWSKREDDKDCALVLSSSWYTMHLRAKSRSLVVDTGKVGENLEKVDVVLILIWYLNLQNCLFGNYLKKIVLPPWTYYTRMLTKSRLTIGKLYQNRKYELKVLNIL